MITKILLLITLLFYSFIVSQSFMYILALRDVSLNLDVSSYIAFRKLVDASMTANFKYVIYGTLLVNLMLVIFTAKSPSGLLFITASVAFVALAIDVILTVKGNLPINVQINAWTTDNYPANWTEYRDNWLAFFRYRQIANITGFTSLLIGSVFGAK